MKTIKEIRRAFWEQLPAELQWEYRSKKRQNEYNADIRCAFVDYVEALAKDGTITEGLAQRATL